MTERPHLGTSEVWRFINRSGITHPMHLHLVMFQLLDRQPFLLDGEDVVPQGDPLPPGPGETGWKDTVQVGPFEIVRIIARFEDFAGHFPYHCHILEHEDHEMMRQFEAVAVCGDGALAEGFEECDDGNDEDGDGCDADCRVGALEPDAGAQDGGADAGRDSGAEHRDAASDEERDAGAAARASEGCSCRVVGAGVEERSHRTWGSLVGFVLFAGALGGRLRRVTRRSHT